MQLRTLQFIPLLLLIVAHLSCAHAPVDFPKEPVDPDNAAAQLSAAKEAYQLASQAQKKGDKIGLAEMGMAFAERCAILAPQEPACPFYQALNTGLYYEARVFGYPTGMVKIAGAAKRVIDLDAGFDQGGAYRILGKLYLEAPSFNIGSNEITRDLDKSRHYLENACSVAPDYPENHLFLAETLVALKEKDEAREQVSIAEEKIKTGQFTQQELSEWKIILTKLQKALNK